MKLLYWVLIIVAVAAIAFFAGRAVGKKSPEMASKSEDEAIKKELAPDKKTGLDTKASSK